MRFSKFNIIAFLGQVNAQKLVRRVFGVEKSIVNVKFAKI